MDNDEVRKFIRSRFDDDEWRMLMDSIHENSVSCTDDEMELRRKYWRLKKAESRMKIRAKRMDNPLFIRWLLRRGLPTSKYKHAYWRDFLKDGGS